MATWTSPIELDAASLESLRQQPTFRPPRDPSLLVPPPTAEVRAAWAVLEDARAQLRGTVPIRDLAGLLATVEDAHAALLAALETAERAWATLALDAEPLARAAVRQALVDAERGEGDAFLLVGRINDLIVKRERVATRDARRQRFAAEAT